MTFTSNLGRTVNPVCHVEFAGFRSTTLALQQAGWSLAYEHDYSRAGLRLALKFEPAQVYAITAPVNMGDIHRMMMDPNRAFEWPVIFRVNRIFHEGRVEIMTMPSANKWFAMDAEPSFAHQREIRSLEDLIPFRPIATEAPEIVISQDNMPAMLEAILKFQEPKQAEIRERQRKEAWRDRNAIDGSGYNPVRDIRAQIITLAG